MASKINQRARFTCTQPVTMLIVCNVGGSSEYNNF